MIYFFIQSIFISLLELTYTNMNYLEQHPFIIVLILSFLFMFFLMKDNRRSARHRKHQMDIERKKNAKKLLNESKNG